MLLFYTTGIEIEGVLSLNENIFIKICSKLHFLSYYVLRGHLPISTYFKLKFNLTKRNTLRDILESFMTIEI